MKKVLKGTACVLLALSLMASVTACSKGSNSSTTSGTSGGKITLTIWDQSVGETDPTAKLLPEVVKDVG